MGLVNLNIFPRSTTGKSNARRLRAAGRVPAVVYGRERETEKIELDGHEFFVAQQRLGGRAAIFNLEQEGVEEEHIALLREVQRNPVTDEILHVDLMEIPRGVPVTVAVAVRVVGESKTVKNGEGSVALSLDAIELSCRPSQLPDYIDVDISDLELNDKIFVGDLEAPVGEFVADPEMLVLNIVPATILVEEEEEAEGEEGEEGAEGAEAAEGEEGEAPAGSEDGGDEKE